MANTRVLLVEGRDDVHVFCRLCEQHGIALREDRDAEDGLLDSVIVRDTEGFDNLVRVLPVQINESGLERLGLLVDADTDVQAR